MNLENLDIRHLDEESRPQYIELCKYCFGGTDADYEFYLREEEEFAATLAAFAGTKLACAMRYFPFDMRMRDTFVRMGGVAAVATWPEYRNRGVVRVLLTRLQEQMRDEKRPLSVLMPFKPSYYRDMGWETTFDVVLADFEPHKIKDFPDEGYTVRELENADEWEALEALNTQFGARYNGSVCRSRLYWERRYFRAGGKKRQVYLVEKSGEPRGFIAAMLTDPAGEMNERNLAVRQTVWLDAGAQRAIFRFFRSLRDQAKLIKTFLPADVRIGHLFDDPRIEQRRQPKMMTKLVDVPVAISSITYDPDLRGEIALRVTAERTAPWNDGTYRLQFADGGVKVDTIATEAEAVEIKIQNLAELYTGYRTVMELRESLDVRGPEAQLELLDAAFPAHPTYIDDWF